MIVHIFQLDTVPDDASYLSSLSEQQKAQLQEISRQRVHEFKVNRTLDREFHAFIVLLNNAYIRYLLVGGYAVGYYTHRENIGDIDLWIDASTANLEKLLEVLRTAGFHHPSLLPESISLANTVLQLGLPPHRIDLLIYLRDLDFDYCFERRLEEIFCGVRVPIISLSDLKQSKKASGRDKDLIDLRQM